MKKSLLFFILNFIFIVKVFSCSYIPESFCSTSQSELYKENLIVLGKIISIDNEGINFEIVDILRGVENNKIIRIWNGVDFDCNGNWSMAASELGEVNDILIMILPKISEKKNTWEVIGDYRRPDFFGFTPTLKVQNGFVYGLISGTPINSNIEEQTSYQNFKNSWNTNNNCSSVVLNIKNQEIENKTEIIKVSNHKFKILTKINTNYQVNIFNPLGLQITSEIYSKKNNEINLSNYSSGIYFINIVYKNNKREILKIINK